MEYEEHEKRAWSVDFSHTDPSMLVSGSDDCKVKRTSSFLFLLFMVFSTVANVQLTKLTNRADRGVCHSALWISNSWKLLIDYFANACLNYANLFELQTSFCYTLCSWVYHQQIRRVRCSRQQGP